MYVSQNYSFAILRPLQQEILARGGEVKWFLEGSEINHSLLSNDENRIKSIEEVIAWQPDAAFVPGNTIPNFIPGLKVQVFHGFEWKKKGHFVIRDCFDLYCTQGPIFTEKFNELANKHQYFDVIETGWPKLDPLLKSSKLETNNPELPCILYAPTFSPSLTSAPDLFDEIVKLSHQNQWQWIVKFHPKMDKKWLNAFKAASHTKLQIIESEFIDPILHAGDVIVSDTSSIITEFMLLSKPAITYKNSQPEPELIDFDEPTELAEKINQALGLSLEQRKKIDEYTARMHPYSDGLSASRVLSAANKTIIEGVNAPKKRPRNIIRNFKMRKRLGYWK